MATQKWIAGAVSTLTSIDTSVYNSLASGNALISGTQIDNSTALDMFGGVELVLASLAAVAPNFVGIYLYPLNSDNSTYGDTRFTTTTAGPPPSTYYVGSIAYDPSTGAKQGSLDFIRIPPGKFKYVLFNQMGVNFASSGNVLKHRTYNIAVA